MVLTSFSRAESLSRAKSSFTKAKSFFSRSSPEPVQEKKQFTEPEKIKVPALFNEQQIKKRKSFVVEADVIIQDGEIAGRVATNDPSARVGCVLKPTQSMRDVMTPAHSVQTWHKKSNFSASTPALSRNSSAPSSYSAPTQRGVRNAFALEQALEALEEIEVEMKDLREVIADAEAYSENPQLQKAMARLASQKKATLQDKLNHLVFEGEDCHVFDKLKEKLHRALCTMTVDWSSGGLDLSPAEVRLSGASPKPFDLMGGSSKSLFGGSQAPSFRRHISR
mmetsp:Transcript_24513/g.58368  ORF Transcript_24513/g.58368 Transcript_24513/m.58368 type:complete len:280 (-) Transcript_24513:76-915(-)|eukprot:2040614-Rhodomonas_salina.1